MAKKTVDDLQVKGRRVLLRCDFNVPLKAGEITDETRIVAALPTIEKLRGDGAKVILCSHLGKVKNGPNEGESLAPVAKRLSEKLGTEVKFVNIDTVTGPEATAAVEAMADGDVILLQNTRFRKEETKNGEAFSQELADLADDYVCDAFGSSHRAHCSVAGVTDAIRAKGGQCAVGYLMEGDRLPGQRRGESRPALRGHPGGRQGGGQAQRHRQPPGEVRHPPHRRRHGLHLPEGPGL